MFLMKLGLINEPLQIMNTTTAVYIGIVYSYLPFMILPLYASLEKIKPVAARSSRRPGLAALAGLLASDVSAVAAGRFCRLPAGLHSGRRRVRHSRSAGRLATR